MSFDADDIAQFFDEDMPGYAVATFGSDTIPGIFSDGYQPVIGLVESAEPQFTCAIELVAGLQNDDSIQVVHGGITEQFNVNNQQPDGNGYLVLVLGRT